MKTCPPLLPVSTSSHRGVAHTVSLVKSKVNKGKGKVMGEEKAITKRENFSFPRKTKRKPRK